MKRHAYALAIAGMICMGAIYAFPSQRALAHTFSGDENGSFLAMVATMKAELQLVKSNLVSNVTLATDHSDHAIEHLDNDTIKEITEKNQRLGTDLPASLNDLRDALESGNFTAAGVDEQITDINNLLDETVSVRIEKAQQTNSTVQALELAGIVDEALEHYNGAFGIEEEEEHDHDSNMTEDNGNDTMQIGNSSKGNATMEEHDTIVNMADYQSSQAYAAVAQDLFNTKLKAAADANATQAVTALDAGLKHLKQAIDDKEPHDDVDTIVHGEVHPNIQKAYNLQVIPEFPLPLLLTIPAIAGIIAATRIRALRK